MAKKNSRIFQNRTACNMWFGRSLRLFRSLNNNEKYKFNQTAHCVNIVVSPGFSTFSQEKTIKKIEIRHSQRSIKIKFPIGKPTVKSMNGAKFSVKKLFTGGRKKNAHHSKTNNTFTLNI